MVSKVKDIPIHELKSMDEMIDPVLFAENLMKDPEKLKCGMLCIKPPPGFSVRKTDYDKIKRTVKYLTQLRQRCIHQKQFHVLTADENLVETNFIKFRTEHM
jgi:hypothetical protein